MSLGRSWRAKPINNTEAMTVALTADGQRHAATTALLRCLFERLTQLAQLRDRALRVGRRPGQLALAWLAERGLTRVTVEAGPSTSSVGGAGHGDATRSPACCSTERSLTERVIRPRATTHRECVDLATDRHRFVIAQ